MTTLPRRIHLLLSVALLLPTGVSAQAKKTLTVADRAVTWNGKTFSLPCPKEDLIKALGPPDRVESLANEILIWDKLGLFAYARPRGGDVFGFNVALGDMRKFLKFAPAMPFAGVLQADGATITPKEDLATINKNKKGKPFVPGGASYSWRAAGDGFVCFLNRGTVDRWSEEGPFVEFSVEILRGK